MQICASKRSTRLLLTAALALSTAGLACQPAANTNVAANTSASPANANFSASPNAGASPAAAGGVINTREPDKYSATLVLTAQTTGGDRAIAIPQVAADVARNGSDHRIAFKVPTGEQVIYLDKGNSHYVILPSRKQYAELTPDATGFQIASLMTPGQLVAYLSKQPGYTRVGDEQMNGRTAEKYAYAATAKTNSQAGDVNTQTYVYVDKDTGLPLRAELFSQATGSVQGVKGVNAVVEMRDIKTDVDPSMFDVPQGYNKVDAQQVRQQVEAVAAVIGAMLKNMNLPSGGSSTTTTTTTTTTTSSPSASPSPKSTP